jgi:hypothetical protein
MDWKMPIPHTLVNFSAALACWVLAAWIPQPGSPALAASGPAPNPLAVCGSPYGALMARLIKGALDSYWHGGPQGQPSHEGEAPPALASRLRIRSSMPLPALAGEKLGLEGWANSLSSLEFRRTRRTSPAELSQAHKRYLNAAANRRLRLAFKLDPGDPALYEILHYSLEATAKDPASIRQAARALAMQTVDQALSFQGSPAAALTGAGAMLNLMNQAAAPPDVLEADWGLHLRCLDRYHSLLRLGKQEGWWDNMPDSRRSEIESYARLVERLSGEAGQFIQRNGVSPSLRQVPSS